MKALRPHRSGIVTLADRFWVGFGCALGGVLEACVALILVGADVFAALLSSAYIAGGEHSLWEIDEGQLPRLRLWAVLFATILFAGTTFLCLP